MRDLRLDHDDVAISEAAGAFLSHLLHVFDQKDPDPSFWSERIKKRHAVSLLSRELAAQLFYCSAPRNTDFSGRLIASMIIGRHEADWVKLRQASQRLILKHHEIILALALELTRTGKMSHEQLESFLLTRKSPVATG